MSNKKLGNVQKTIVGAQFLLVAFLGNGIGPSTCRHGPPVVLFTAGLGTLIFHMITKVTSPSVA